MTTLQLVSTEECIEILKTQLSAKQIETEKLYIKDIQLKQITNCSGFLGEYYTLTIVAASTLSAKERLFDYFIKTLPQQNLQYREECERKGVLRKESAIYKEIIPKLQRYANCKLAPTCFLTREDLLVLENLSFDYRQLPALEDYNMTQYRVLLSHLATLHATSIAWERAESFSIGERYREMLFELMLSSENDWFITSIKAIVYLAAQHEQLQHEKYQHFIANKLYEKLLKTETLVQPTERMCNVFCHRDASNFNIFFAKHDAERCCLVDFGLSTYSTPAHDIHFMLYMNSTQTTRQLLYQEFIKWYFDALQAKFAELGIPATELSWQEFQADCKRASLVALIISCLCLPIHLLPSKLMATVRSQQAQKFDYWLNVDRRELLDMAMAQDPAYKAKIMALIKELMEQLLASEAQES